MGELAMKKIPVCLIIALSTILALPDSTVATAQKKERKAEKEPAVETKQIPQEQLDSMLKAMKEREEIASGLKFQQGEIKLKDGLATLKVSAKFRYLDPDQTDTVLVQLWGNPPSQEKTLGMLFPAEISPSAPESWGVVITYDEDGYVKDDEAAGINYDDLLKGMQEGTREANQERIKQGYEAIELIGWAAPPRYDQTAHKLYWAKELSFGGEPEHTLNYDIRALGRRGVLSLNAVASVSQLQMVEKDMREVLSFVEFNEGHRYGDYVAGVDKVAAYGIGALIAGKLAAKAGLFKLLLLFAAKFWKLLIIAALAIGALVKKLLSGRRKEEPAPGVAE
jgi:uncharacterized membrane-anchored protein